MSGFIDILKYNYGSAHCQASHANFKEHIVKKLEVEIY